MERLARARRLATRSDSKLSGEPMGEIRVKVKLVNAADHEYARQGRIAASEVRFVETEAVVDTGAVTSVIPQAVLDQLGLSTPWDMVVRYADGRTESVPVSNAILFELLDRHTIDEAAVLGDEVLLGQTILEKTDLLADCYGQRLIPNPEHPDRAVIKIR